MPKPRYIKFPLLFQIELTTLKKLGLLSLLILYTCLSNILSAFVVADMLLLSYEAMMGLRNQKTFNLEQRGRKDRRKYLCKRIDKE